MKSRNTDRTYDWNGHKGLPISFSHLTDEQMAGTVRMLMRHDLGHEGIVCGARDRIMCLVKEKATLEARIAELETGIKRLSDEEELCDETNGDDPFSIVRLAAKLAAVEHELAGAKHVAKNALSDLQYWQNQYEELAADPTRQTKMTGWKPISDEAKEAGRILLVWPPFGNISEHIELGRWSEAKGVWVNTYGKAFSYPPEQWSPLAPYTAPVEQMTGYEEAIDAAKMARNRLMTYANGVQRGEIQGGGREFERRIWGAFSDFDQACAALTTEGQP